MKDGERLYIIDVFRFLAAISVVLFHYTFLSARYGMIEQTFPALQNVTKYGYLGVELFFVISGFVILMSAWKVDLIGFISSRIGRLFPAYWLCCTLTVLVFLLPMSSHQIGIAQYLMNMTMFQKFFDVASVDGSYWTLYYELIFYLMIAFVLLFKRFINFEYFAYVWLVISVYAAFFNVNSGNAVFKALRTLTLDHYSSLFISGMLFFLIWQSGVSLKRIGFLTISMVLSIFYALLHAAGYNVSSQYGLDLKIVAGIIVVIYAVMFMVSIKKLVIKTNRVTATIGAMTYPLYLLHQQIGYSLFKNFAQMNSGLLLVGVICCMLVMSWLVSHLIEARFCKVLKRRVESFLREGCARLARDSHLGKMGTIVSAAIDSDEKRQGNG